MRLRLRLYRLKMLECLKPIHIHTKLTYELKNENVEIFLKFE